MSKQFGVFSVETAAEIHRRVLGNSSPQKPTDGQKQLLLPAREYYVKLTEDLVEASNPETGYTQAEAVFLRYKQPAEDSLSMEESGEDSTLTITNRSTSYSATSGSVLQVKRIGAEWAPIAAAAVEAVGGIISFAIISSDPLIRRALVEIRQRNFKGPVYGSVLNDEVVYVYDTDGCWLNKPNVELTGVLGKAVLMFTDQEAIATHFPEATGTGTGTYICTGTGSGTGTGTGTGTGGCEAPPKYWNVLTVCCAETIC